MPLGLHRLLSASETCQRGLLLGGLRVALGRSETATEEEDVQRILLEGSLRRFLLGMVEELRTTMKEALSKQPWYSAPRLVGLAEQAVGVESRLVPRAAVRPLLAALVIDVGWRQRLLHRFLLSWFLYAPRRWLL